MPIQWFPGHMASARKKAAETMAGIDVVIEVLDARLPAASANPMIEELRRARQRACLKLLNKADLADPVATREWLDFLNREPGVKAVAMSARDDNTKPLRMMIMGIPNVGKSTLMNALVKRRIAAVGDEPAVTKSQQRVVLGPRLVLVDTPGLMWPKIEHDADGYMLAASHAIGRNAVPEEEVAVFLAGILLARYPGLLAARYGFALAGLDAPGVLEAVARRRGCLLKGRGGEPDLERAALLLLQDYRDGALGRVSLETPASRRAMLATETPTPPALEA
ncbi:MAG: ribosome biogenesis GTPase YlqF [Thiobacillaceae bacterium]|nr:ribosome biogenesis GTPase YlqF [Thiobacillaceae bacterium]